jgi:4-aminobutyrate aminotransferase-like enzyme
MALSGVPLPSSVTLPSASTLVDLVVSRDLRVEQIPLEGERLDQLLARLVARHERIDRVRRHGLEAGVDTLAVVADSLLLGEALVAGERPPRVEAPEHGLRVWAVRLLPTLVEVVFLQGLEVARVERAQAFHLGIE